MVKLLVKLGSLLRRGFFFLLFLFCKILLSLVHLIYLLVDIWSSFLRPLIGDFFSTMIHTFLDLVLMPFLAFLGTILGFFVDKFLKALMRLLEALCFLFFFLWEICEWKLYRRSFLFGIYFIFLILLWFCYFTFLFTIYDSACLCCMERGEARCGALFFLLAYTTFFFFELRRALRRFLEAKLLRK